MNKKKKIIGGIILAVILIGMIVVFVKGFNIGLSLRPHYTLKFVFEQKYELKDVKAICKDVFGKKDFRIRGVEVFDDSVYIEASTITEEEQKLLAQKLGALYKTEKIDETTTEEAEENYKIYNDSNVRLTEEVKPYILPACISSIIVLFYTAIRFKKLEEGKVHITLVKLIVESLIIILTILSVIAIFRISFEKILFSILIVVEIIYLIIKFVILERKLKEV